MRCLNRIGLTGFIALFFFLGLFLGSVQAQFVVTNTNDDGTGSLRQAINEANNTEVQSTISFNIPGDPGEIHTIIPQSTLPLILNSTILDATTQPGYTTGNPKIVLDGSDLSAGSGIRIFGNNSIVRGFSIVAFKGTLQGQGSGILIEGGGDKSRGGHKIEANFLGVLPDGTSKGNARGGVDLFESPGNVIGGRTAAERNVISGNLEGIGLRGADNNLIEGNYIGTNPAGDEAIGNTINIIIFGASGNTIGGLEEGSGNVISGGTSMGIRFVADIGTAEDNLIQGNLIGTSADGVSALPNNSGIVFNSKAYNNIIGDDSEAGRNIISGNFVYGIKFNSGSSSFEITGNQIFGNYIGLNINGEALGNQVGIVTIDNVEENNIGVPSKASNVISGNTVTGIRILNGTGLKVQNNLIGTSPDGLSAIPNLFNGIDVGGPDNLIGGNSAGERNIISGNGQYGIQLRNVLGSASGNIIQGNFIGTDISGNSAIANEQSGIFIFDAINNTIGGVNSSDRNIISGNIQDGILFAGSEANSNNVLGNYIGLNSTGTAAVGNGRYGIFLNSSGGNFIGGTLPGERNIISGNNQDGIYLNNTATTGNSISGNYIGLNPQGESGIGNGLSGIRIVNAPANQIFGNVISHNGQSFNASGIEIFGAQASDNQVRTNKIGTNSSGTAPLSNNGPGLLIAAPKTIIGGSSFEDGNIISGNTLDGIFISFSQGDASETTIQNNLIGVGGDAITPMGNNRDGIAILGSSHNLIGGESGQTPAFQNIIAFNGGNGVSLEPGEGAVPLSNGILGNSIFSNSARGIALGLASRVPNDPDDSDDGPNRLQNFPEIETIEYDDNSHAFDLTYIVPSAPANSGYPIRVEFFLSEGVTQGKTYFGFDLFEESDYLNFINNGVQKSISLTLLSTVDVPEEYFVTSTATDSELNTSEFSDTAPSTDPVAGVSYTVTNTNDKGEGSLRSAITEANKSAFRDTIQFDISGVGPHIINIESQFVSFSNPVILDATTQTGYDAQTGEPVIILDGSLAPEGTNALVFTEPTSGSSIKGFSIVGFPGDAILLFSDENEVMGNYIGILPDGTVSSNTGDGIEIRIGSNNRVGAEGIENRNIISGNKIGINISEGATGNEIRNNLIGTAPDGENSVTNSEDGIIITSSSANIIGGSEVGHRNVISGNTRNGITIQGSNASGNLISGNYIGVATGGSTGLGNGSRGVHIFNSPGNTIIENVISHNGQLGNSPGVEVFGDFAVNNELLANRIGTNADGTAELANTSSGIIIRALNTNISGNVISGNNRFGVNILSFQATAGNTQIEDNFIGVGADGATPIPNIFDGIFIDNSSGNVIGGSGSGSGNVISGNSRHGINIQGENSAANSIKGNFIGLDHEGTAKVSNGLDGILLTGTGGNFVGGVADTERNTVSGNNRYGIHIQGFSASGNNIIGNFIGVDETGLTGIGNGSFGVNIFNAPENQLASNVISHNGQASNAGGIHLHGEGAVGNLLRSNRIGTNASGNTAIGNNGSGILVRTLSTIVGGNSIDDGNVISGNSNHGIFLITSSASTESTTIRNNHIGIGADGLTPIGNGFDGINISGSSKNVIGRSIDQTAASPNLIAHNGRNGITLEVLGDDIPVSNSILSNSIFSNNFRGIDLGLNGRTPNDSDDSDNGPNKLQNYPEFSSVEYISDENRLDITYIVSSAPANSDYPILVEFFLADDTDQGKTYLGFDLFEESDYTAFADNEIYKSVQLSIPQEIIISEGFSITSTATDAELNTSEFSETEMTGPPPATGKFVVTTTSDTGEGSLRWAIEQSNATATRDTISFNIENSGPHTILMLSQFDSFINPIVLDASTQPEYTAGNPVIVLDGSQARDDSRGFVFTNTANGSEVKGFSIVGFKRDNNSGGDGIVLLGNNNLVSENFIGILPDGTPMGNEGNGIVITGSSGNTIGGINPGSRNVISANNTGIDLRNGASNNQILNNYIGTSIEGNTAAANLDGIMITSSSGNFIGNLDGSGRNIVSGNERHGIIIQGPTSTENNITGNFIGVDHTGTTGLGNGHFGVEIFASPANLISENVISHNGQAFASAGIHLSNQAAINNNIRANRIGTSADGLSAIPNTGPGIFVRTLNTLIGGDNAEDGNVISGNSSHGIVITISQASAGSTVIRNNYIGVGADGQEPLGNTLDGILIDGSSDNVIGGETIEPGDSPLSPNLIAHNGRNGISLSTHPEDQHPISNSILGNKIFQNNLEGIDLGLNGRTPNDSADSDNGPNKLQNFPVISNAVESTVDENLLLEINYTVPSSPTYSAYPLRVEFFLSDGDNQGKTYLGYDMFSESDFENEKTALLEISSFNSVPEGWLLVSTATDNDGNTSHFSDAAEFTGPLEVATLISPGNGAFDVGVNPTLTWATVSGATAYRVQLSETADFTSAVIDEDGISGTELETSNLNYETEYFWRVQASNNAGDGEWSSFFSFTTIEEIILVTKTESIDENGGVLFDDASGVELTFPEAAVSSTTEITFGIYNVIPEGATISGLLVSLSGPDSEPVTFNEPVLIKVNYDPDNLPVGVTEENLKLLRYSEITEEWSELDTEVDTFEKTASAFTLGFSGFGAGWVEGNLLPPSVVTLNTPENEAVNVSITPMFTWEETSTAESYQLQVSEVDDFASAVIDQSEISATEFEAGELEYETTFYWRVRASNDAGEGEWSEGWSFTTEEEPSTPPGIVNLSSPENEAVNVSITPMFTWEETSTAESYQLQVSEVDDFASAVIDQSEISATEFEAGGLEYETTFYWRVRASNDAGEGEWSEGWSFITEEEPLSAPDAVALRSPANESIDVPINPTLSWEPTELADNYTVQVSIETDFTEPLVNESDVTATELEVSGLIHEQLYHWRVRAVNESGASDWSEEWSFTTVMDVPESVTLISPEDGSDEVETSPLLVWTASERAEVHDLQLTKNSDFSDLLIDASDLQNTEYQITDDLETGTTYYWRVRAGNQSGYSEWSEPLSFTTVLATSIFTEVLPKELVLSQNYPNPFNPATQIRFALPEQAHVTLSVYNLLGQRVAILVDESHSAGWHEVTFEASALSSGIFMYRIIAGNNVQIKHMVLVK